MTDLNALTLITGVFVTDLSALTLITRVSVTDLNAELNHRGLCD